MLDTFLFYSVIFFPVSETVLLLFKRSGNSSAGQDDRGSLKILWLTISVAVAVSVTAASFGTATLPISLILCRSIALTLFLTGFIVRWTAILSLGKFFTVDVSAQQDHALVVRGIYKYARHPSYTGLLLLFAGLAFNFGTWISVTVIIIPITAAVLYRIRCEEILLRKIFGTQYDAYMIRTQALFPWIF